ncbi:MAG: HAMP domain-containing histidine kinase [Planctomycetes bacterium]|nr:HAMP domain-containing histidine kinase [Planctomycetota bacterium]
MQRTARAWVLFTLCAVALLAGMGWTTAEALRLEEQEARAWSHAGTQGAIRVALGRLEAALAPLLAPEEARPYLHYLAYYPPPQTFESPGNPARDSSLLLPSPLRDATPRFVRLHFEVSPDGDVTSPQVRGEGKKAVGARSLDRIRELVSIFEGTPLSQQWAEVEVQQSRVLEGSNLQGGQRLQQADAVQQAWTQNEYLARNATQNFVRGIINKQRNDDNRALVDLAVEQGPLRAVWVDVGEEPELFFLRRVAAKGRSWIQGQWWDWPALRSWLLEQVADIFPGATLEPARTPATKDGVPAADAGRRLATVPAVLSPGALLSPDPIGWSPTRVGLLVTWIAILAALGSVAMVLRASLQLAERRGRFVSAVTHELRTPLTTFQMYAQMLADGMVPSAEARQEYLETLKGESARLARVVESVLLYSQIERGGREVRTERIEVTDLVDRLLPPMSSRAAEGGMELVVDHGTLDGVAVAVDVQAVEQIFLNLVDNACKYAADAADRGLRLDIAPRNGFLEIRFSDRGPGIPHDVRSTLFDPYQRAKRHEAGPVSGVGLGLALARGLARALGGDLELMDRDEEGAGFKITLPLSPAR